MNQKSTIFLTDEEKLRVHLKTSYTERFRMLMRMIKLGQKLKDAKIIQAKP